MQNNYYGTAVTILVTVFLQYSPLFCIIFESQQPFFIIKNITYFRPEYSDILYDISYFFHSYYCLSQSLNP